MMPADTPPLTPSQEAALAKVACGSRRPGGVALLCGPRGVGTSLVLSRLQRLESRQGRVVEHRGIRDWFEVVDGGHGELPDVVLADDAHLATADGLARLLDRCLARRPATAMVLAGEGRLLTLVSRDGRLEAAISLRAALRPCSLDETRMVVAALARTASFDDGALNAIHEIAAGIPAAVRRLVELADIVAAANPESRIDTREVEAIHRRLSPLAA
jgi:hypothetical protein